MITALRRFFAGLLGGLLSVLTLRLLPVNKSGRQAVSDPRRDDDHPGETEHAAAPTATMAAPQRPSGAKHRSARPLL